MTERVGHLVARGVSARRVVVLHPSLGARYTSVVAAVAPAVEAGLSPSVAANRVVASSVEPPTLRLAPWRDERARFGRELARLAGADEALLFADVRACYRSIRPDVVERSLVVLGCDRVAARAVGTFLAGLAAFGIEGLPVGPDPSPVLANAVLAEVDREISGIGIRHLRWVDDVVAGVRGREEAELVIDAVRVALARLDLELNEEKTRVVVDPDARAGVASVSVARRLVPVG